MKLKDSLHYQQFWPECLAWMSSLDGNMLQNSSLRRESAIVESEPVGHGVLLVIVAPCQLFLLSRPKYGRIIPLAAIRELIGLRSQTARRKRGMIPPLHE